MVFCISAGLADSSRPMEGILGAYRSMAIPPTLLISGARKTMKFS